MKIRGTDLSGEWCYGEYVKFDDSCDSVESGNFCYSANLVILLVVVFLVDAVNLVIVVILVNLQIYK